MPAATRVAPARSMKEERTLGRTLPPSIGNAGSRLKTASTRSAKTKFHRKENGVLTDQNENGLCKSAGYYGRVRAFHTNSILSRAADLARIIEIGFGTVIAT